MYMYCDLFNSDTRGASMTEVEEELDYDENMDDIDVHVYRPEDLDVQENEKEEKNTDPSINSSEKCCIHMYLYIFMLCQFTVFIQ